MIERIKRLLTPPAFEDPEKTRKAKILNFVLFLTLILLGSMMIGFLASGLYTFRSFTVLILSILLVVIMGMLVVSRRGYVYAASVGLVLSGWIMLTLLAWNADGIRDSAYIAYFIIIAVAGLLLGWKSGLVFAGLSILAGWGFAYAETIGIIQPVGEETITIALQSTTIFALSAAILALTTYSLSTALEAAKQSNQELEELSASLENRVERRTQDLALASEIGNILAQIHDLDALLQEAVELIRSRFDFYYTQIYLADEAGRTLTLRAGTGDLGQELTRRGHRLLIGSGSINGTAVAQKKTVIVSDTAAHSLFRPNPLLPHTRSEMAVPLVVGSRVVGILDLQSSEKNGLSSENLLTFNALAGQLAIAIENARLLTDIDEARAEIESFTRRITHEGWESYLDAVERPHFMGFTSDQDSLAPLDSPLPVMSEAGNVTQVPVKIIGETIGTIQIEADEDHIWTEGELDLIQSVAAQVGQQVEILRSLNEAAHYRQEAERTLRRLTHEAWEVYGESSELVDGFVYDQIEVKPVTVSSLGEIPTADLIQQPLSLHGEVIGEIMLAKADNTDDAFTDELVTAVATTLSAHLENLRLTEQTEKALAETRRRAEETQAINQVAELVSRQTDRQQMLTAVLAQIRRIVSIDAFLVGIYDVDQNLIEYPFVYDDGEMFQYAPATPMADSRVMEVIRKGEMIVINRTPEEVAALTEEGNAASMGQEQKISAALLYVPLQVGERILGVLSVQSYTHNAFSEADISLIFGIANYVAVALDNARLFAESQKRATQEQILREITTRVHTAVDAESILKTAAKEIQRTFGVEAFVYLDAPQSPSNGKQQ